MIFFIFVKLFIQFLIKFILYSMKNTENNKYNEMSTFVYENPIDVLFYHIIHYISDIVYHLNITPNMITTIGLLCSLISAYYLYNKDLFIAFIFWILSYYFDLLDGYIARKYNMGSVFGGWYDHISDIIKISVFLYVFYLHKKYDIIIIILLIALLSLINTSCRTKYLGRDKNPTDSLYILQKSCPNKQYVRYTRYIGEGTLALIAPIIVYILYNK